MQSWLTWASTAVLAGEIWVSPVLQWGLPPALFSAALQLITVSFHYHKSSLLAWPTFPSLQTPSRSIINSTASTWVLEILGLELLLEVQWPQCTDILQSYSKLDVDTCGLVKVTFMAYFTVTPYSACTYSSGGRWIHQKVSRLMERRQGAAAQWEMDALVPLNFPALSL